MLPESKLFSESWTEYFRDKRSFSVSVVLKINGEVVHRPLNFIGVDGWRYFVPLPKKAEAYGEHYYYWDKSSVEYKVFKIIGRVDYLFHDLEQFGQACGVKIK